MQSLSEYKSELGLESEEEISKWKFENAWRIVQAVGAGSIKKVLGNTKKPKQEIASVLSAKGFIYFYKTDYNHETKDPRIRMLFADDYLLYNPGDLWLDIKTTGGFSTEGGVYFPKGKKPERLLKRIIKLATKEGDLICDFQLGSGTTCAVAHKMGRQYIGIEQLDYAENDSVVRLQSVIKGDQSGISKIVNWEGGGSFLYCELMEYNEAYVGRIQKAKTINDLLAIWKEMQGKAFISYKVEPKAINEHITDFDKLSLDEQKYFLIEVLDKNQLYVNYSEIDDEQYGVTETDKKFNHIFYEKI